MKELKFKTSKGEFLVSESDEHYDYRFIGLLSRISEEQASEIVVKNEFTPTYKDELFIRLKSKGIYLYDNPVDLNEQLDCNCDMCYQKLEDSFDEAEAKTFYNPYIFKIND